MTILQKIIAVLCIILALVAVVFGSYMPLVKSRGYIKAIRSLSTLSNIQDFEATFRDVLEYPSPVGQEEVVKFFGGDVLGNIIQQNSEEASRELVRFIEQYLFKNDVRHLLMGGNFYWVLWNRFHHEGDYAAAEAYLLAARAIGPNLPPVLYNLLELYMNKGDMEKAKNIAGVILSYWPQDANVRSFYEGSG